jgi:hypothetical protein
MRYNIELNDSELKALKKFLKEDYDTVRALRNNKVFRVEYKDGDSLESREHELLLLLGKIGNIIPIADKIVEVK